MTTWRGGTAFGWIGYFVSFPRGTLGLSTGRAEWAAGWAARAAEAKTVHTGEFREGRNSGFGVRKYVDGGRYEGEWVGGFKHGKGLLVLPNGERYKGDFVRGVVHGCPAARRPAWGPVEVRGRRVAAHAARRLSGATGAGRQNQVWRGAGAVRGPVPGRV